MTARRGNPQRRAGQAGVEIWYDHSTRSWIVQRKDAHGNQIGTADYVHSKREAQLIAAQYRKQNPSHRQAEQIEAAAKLQADFSGHEPGNVDTVRVPDAKVFTPVGKLAGVMYDTIRDGKAEKYIHRFRRKSRPLLAASHDGTELRIVGGRFRFNEAGIVDE